MRFGGGLVSLCFLVSFPFTFRQGCVVGLVEDIYVNEMKSLQRCAGKWRNRGRFLKSDLLEMSDLGEMTFLLWFLTFLPSNGAGG